MSTDDDVKAALTRLCAGLPVNPLPPPRHRDESLPHAPTRIHTLNAHQQKVSYAILLCLCCFLYKVHDDKDESDDTDIAHVNEDLNEI